MRAFCTRFCSGILLLLLFAGCANIVPPTGGKKDVTPPRLLEVFPKDSMLNTRVTRIDMRFDEFVSLKDAAKEIQVSPVIPFPLNSQLTGKKLTVKIPDSLLKENTTYRINFGHAIKDLNEGNEFKNYNYIFSTGDFFDSLSVAGFVYNASTGKPLSEVTILLYEADDNDSAVVKKKPVYTTKTKGNGSFLLPGLPCNAFRIYALKDGNENLVYDGEDEEIGFVDSIIYPQDSITSQVILRVFKEILPVDSTYLTDSSAIKKPVVTNRRRGSKPDEDILLYTIAVDTADTFRRTFDINKSLKMSFSDPIDTYNVNRLSLFYDSMGVTAKVPIIVRRDTTQKDLLVSAHWKDNTLYTIKVLKDFAKDTAGTMSGPAKYTFRTMAEEDYGVIKVNVDSAYLGKKYILQLIMDKDTAYRHQVTDTVVTIKRLLPGKYELYITVDENENGKWDTGDLFAKKQPELVIPYSNTVKLKSGWENVLDFKKPKPNKPKSGDNDTSSGNDKSETE